MNFKFNLALIAMLSAIGAYASPVQPSERSNVLVNHNDARTIYKNLPRSVGNIRAVGVLVAGELVAYMSESETCQLKTRWYPHPFDGNKFYVLRQGADDLLRVEGCVAVDENKQMISLLTEYSVDAKGYKLVNEPRFTFIRVEWAEAPSFLERAPAQGTKK